MTEQRISEPIAITGATGFIGAHLMDALRREGYAAVGLSRTCSAAGHSQEDVQSRIRQVDVRDRDALRHFFIQEKPATLFHLAGTRGRDDIRGAEAACTELNVKATANLIELALQFGIRRIVLVGSAEEYGNQPGPLHEALPLAPETVYGKSKARATLLAKQMYEEQGCPVVVVRPFSVFGPGQSVDMFLGEAASSAVAGSVFRMSGGDQRRDFVFIDDVVGGLLKAASVKGVEGRIINLGSGIARRLREVAELIWRMTQSPAPLLIGAREAAPQELCDTWADTTLARTVLGWRPETGFEDGLRQTIDWFAEQLTKNERLCQAM
jgi:nucleoside-diphosphate-sugar epimerase